MIAFFSPFNCFIFSYLVFYITLPDSSKCCNCKRKQFNHDPISVYHIDFQVVSSKVIRQFGHKCQSIRKRTSDLTVRDYNLCDECYHFLADSETDFKYLWPGFWWNLLSGGHTPKFEPSHRYFEVKSAQYLWQAVPHSMREWWIDAIRSINVHGSYPYAQCELTSPPSIFLDQTDSLSKFEADLDSGDLDRLLAALDNEDIMNANVLVLLGVLSFASRQTLLTGMLYCNVVFWIPFCRCTANQSTSIYIQCHLTIFVTKMTMTTLC